VARAHTDEGSGGSESRISTQNYFQNVIHGKEQEQYRVQQQWIAERVGMIEVGVCRLFEL
jgi:hypothetical protein